ncbi:tyrosine-protein kinase BAZ1B-like isoform X2 [Oratosquilla oratoria]|uniref:tyrosine-protein kinase BAZ1B-like isoform X2 n=1 Tax=Oratosquilla oratoria TaxID=337810 RepID=UPI003F76B036
MPLLQGQVFRLIKPPDNVDSSSELYVIQHTGEKFVNKSDYEDRLALYSQSIWTCQCSGRSGLTHQEAWTSEAKVRVMLSQTFPPALQKPILSQIHHSTSSLDQLVESTSLLCHTRFHPGEEVLLKGHVPVKVCIVSSKEAPNAVKCENGNSEDASPVAMNGCTSADSSPGSKENHCHTNSLHGAPNGNVTVVRSTSPNKNLDDSPSKKKMLNLMYDVEIIGEGKLISDVPTEHLKRTQKVPPKEHFRLFIRANAMRQRSSSHTPWLVAEDLVKRYNIPNKIASIFFSPKTTGSPGRKRKAEGPGKERLKKPKVEKVDKKPKVEKLKAPKEEKLVKVNKGVMNGPILSPVEIKLETSDSEDDLSLASLVSRAPSKPVSVISPPDRKPSTFDKKPVVPKLTLDLGVAPKLLTSNLDSFLKIEGTPKSEGIVKIKPQAFKGSLLYKADGTPRKRRPNKTKEEKERELQEKARKKNERLKKKEDKIKLKEEKLKMKEMKKEMTEEKRRQKLTRKIKQVTLHELKSPRIGENNMKKGNLESLNFIMQAPVKPQESVSSPTKSPRQKRVWTPETVMKIPLLRKLAHDYKTLKGRKLVYTMDLTVKKLTAAQLKAIPEGDMKNDLLARRDKMVEKKIIEKMSPEEKEEYMKQKAKEMAEKRRQERVMKSMKNMKREDTNIPDLKPLPPPKLVPTPESIPNSLFGDVAMVTEFVQCYKTLLLREEKVQFSTAQLLEALASGPKGFKVITEMMCLLLNVIVQDDIANDYKDFGVQLRTVPVHYQTAPEVARQCLSYKDPSDYQNEENIPGEEEPERREMDEKLLMKMETTELYDLEPEELITILKALCHRVMCCHSLQDFLEDVEEQASKLCKQRSKYKKLDLEEKQKRKEERLKKKVEKMNSPRKKCGRPKGYSPKKKMNTIDSFYSKKEPEKDLISVVKRKRFTIEESRKEREAKEQEERARRKEEAEKMKKELERETVVKRCEEILTQRDFLVRQQPLGTDRNHNRYWLFHSTTPGLYVEKGWVDPSSRYQFYLEMEESQGLQSEIKSQPGITISSEQVNGDSALLHKTKQDDSDDEKPLAAVKKKLGKSPKKVNYEVRKQPGVRGRQKIISALVLNEDETYPPIDQENMWYQYSTMEEVDALLAALDDKGIRDSHLKSILNYQMKRLQDSITACSPTPPCDQDDTKKEEEEEKEKEKEKEEVNWSLALLESLRDDIIQIERELIEGWMGAVPDFDEWEERTKEATSIQTLSECLLEAQKHMQTKFLKGFMRPQKNSSKTENPETEEVECVGTQRWREAVRSCKTYSRLHLLVGMFDSCIMWERSMAVMQPEEADMDGEEIQHEKECRVCYGAVGLIYCAGCPAAYHSECHNPPLQTRARKDWECIDCQSGNNRQTTRSGRFIKKRNYSEETPKVKKIFDISKNSITEESDSFICMGSTSKPKSTKSKSKKKKKNSKRVKITSDDDEYYDEDDFEVKYTRRSSRRTEVKKYIIDSEEEEEDEEGGEEEEEEEEVRDDEDEGEVEFEECQDEEAVCVYCGGAEDRPLVPCMTCDRVYHPACNRAVGEEGKIAQPKDLSVIEKSTFMDSLQCQRCLRVGWSPCKSSLNMLKNSYLMMVGGKGNQVELNDSDEVDDGKNDDVKMEDEEEDDENEEEDEQNEENEDEDDENMDEDEELNEEEYYENYEENNEGEDEDEDDDEEEEEEDNHDHEDDNENEGDNEDNDQEEEDDDNDEVDEEDEETGEDESDDNINQVGDNRDSGNEMEVDEEDEEEQEEELEEEEEEEEEQDSRSEEESDKDEDSS